MVIGYMKIRSDGLRVSRSEEGRLLTFKQRVDQSPVLTRLRALEGARCRQTSLAKDEEITLRITFMLLNSFAEESATQPAWVAIWRRNAVNTH